MSMRLSYLNFYETSLKNNHLLGFPCVGLQHTSQLLFFYQNFHLYHLKVNTWRIETQPTYQTVCFLLSVWDFAVDLASPCQACPCTHVRLAHSCVKAKVWDCSDRLKSVTFLLVVALWVRVEWCSVSSSVLVEWVWTWSIGRDWNFNLKMN